MKKFTGLFVSVLLGGIINVCISSLTHANETYPPLIMAAGRAGCILNTVQGGALSERVDRKGLGSSTGQSGGSAGHIPLNCDTNTILSVSPPIATSPAAQTYIRKSGVQCNVWVQNAPGSSTIHNTSCTNALTQPINSGSSELLLDIDVGGVPIPAGSYGFQVQLLLVPQ
jgi:hypothetical protein